MKLKLILFSFYSIFLIASLKSSEQNCTWPEQNKEFSYFEDRIYQPNHEALFEWSWWPWKKETPKEAKKDPNPFRADNIINLETRLKERVIGQNAAIRTTVAAIESYAMGINDFNSPIASLLYVGPTGVGKTQLAKELANLLLEDANQFIRFNMAEFSDYGSLYRLIGSPRGHLDHAKGGELTDLLKQYPYAIVLFDEIEKAHPRVLKLLLQVLDEGMISDAQGTLIDCRNKIFILTTNLAAQKILTMHDLGSSDKEILKVIQPTLMAELSPELSNRLEPVIFRGLKESLMDDLIKRMLEEFNEDMNLRKQINIEFDSTVIQFVKAQASNYLLGARPLKQFIKQTVVVAITEALKERYLKNQNTAKMYFQEGYLFVYNPQEENLFEWKWNNEKEVIQSPFKLDQLLDLENKLQRKVLGQPQAIKITVDSLMRYAAGIKSPTSPIASLLYVGPTGVGKTQLAKELARELLGSETHLIRINMSEYVEPHSMARLIGSPPGYVNHEEGGQLTEALKQHPFAVVLLDEIEKAHPNVLKTFLQVFDEGYISDSKGIVIDCRNSVFILTTNICAGDILDLQAEGFKEDAIVSAIQPEIMRILSPELFNRLEAVLFTGLTEESFDLLVRNMLKEVQLELANKKLISIDFDSSIVEFLKHDGFDYELGARPLKRLIQQAIITPIAQEIIAKHLQPGDKAMLFYKAGQILIEHMQ